MPRDPAFTAEFIRSILDYDAKTGLFTWRARAECSALRNSIWTGRAAGTNIHGYIQISIYVDGQSVAIYAHRIAWLYIYGEWPQELLDHIDGDKTNNRIGNIREASYSENACNRPKRSDNKTGYTGVAFRKNRNKWEGKITVRQKTVWRKLFNTAEEAHAARTAALPLHHGAFARIS